MYKHQFLYSPFFSHTRTHSHTVFRGCALSRGGCSFQSVQSLTAFGGYTGIFLFMIVPSVVRQRRTARFREEDSHSKTVQSLTAFEGYTGIFPLENPHSRCTSLSHCFLIHQITSTVVAACIGYCWAYLHLYPLSHTLPMADNARQLIYAYRRVAG